MQKNIFLLIVILFSFTAISYTQDFGGNKVGLSNFIKRMYNSQAFEGVKVLEDYNDKYMVIAVALKKDTTKPATTINRIASVKAKAYTSQFLNGSGINTETIITTSTTKTKDTAIQKTEIADLLKETSIGFVNNIELLTNFESIDGKQLVFIYYRELKANKN
jgi:hypothetical protein